VAQTLFPSLSKAATTRRGRARTSFSARSAYGAEEQGPGHTRVIARKFIDLAIQGEALKEIWDRLDGKAGPTVTGPQTSRSLSSLAISTMSIETCYAAYRAPNADFTHTRIECCALAPSTLVFELVVTEGLNEATQYLG
jgi:hypothetical protein